MSEMLPTTPDPLDDQLADFTDRLLAGEAVTPSDDQMLRSLQETVQLLHATLPQEEMASAAMMNRIGRQVSQAIAGQPPAEPAGSPWSRWLARWRHRETPLWQAPPVRLALALALMVVAGFILLPYLGPTEPGPGTATGDGGGSILFIGLVISAILVALAAWWRRR